MFNIQKEERLQYIYIYSLGFLSFFSLSLPLFVSPSSSPSSKARKKDVEFQWNNL